MGVLHDQAVRRLPKDGLQADDGRHAAVDQIAQHVAGPDGRKLVHVAHQQQVTIGPNGLEQRISQHQVEHRRFVDHDQVGVNWVLFVTGKTFGGLELQQAMDCLRLAPASLGQPFGCPAGWGSQHVIVPALVEQVQQGAQGRRLPRARPAGEDRHLVKHGRLDGLHLVRGQADALFSPGPPPLAPQASLQGVQAACGMLDHALHPVGDADLRKVEWRQVDRALFLHNGRLGRRRFPADFILQRLATDRIALDERLALQRLQPGRDFFGGHLQDLRRLGLQLLLRHVDVPLLGHAVQRVGDAGLDPPRIVMGQPERSRDLVGGLEADAVDVLHEAVRLVAHDRQGIVAIFLVDFDRQRRGNAVRLEEDHDIFDRFLLLPRLLDATDALRPNADDVAQPLRVVVDNVQRRLAELVHDALGHLLADAADHARAEIALDALYRGGQGLLALLGLELPPVFAVARPPPAQAQPFAGVHFGQIADDGDQTIAPRRISKTQHIRRVRLQANHRIAVFGVIIGHTLYRAADLAIVVLDHGFILP